MSGAMRKMGVYLGLVEDDAHDDLDTHGTGARVRSYDRDHHRDVVSRIDDRYDYDDDVEHHDEPVEADDVHGSYEPQTDRFEPVVEAPATPAHRITTLHPRTYNEARAIGEEFRDGNPVIMNLSEMDDADAKRLVDFAAGITFGLRGSIERVTTKVFLLSPQKVKVTAEDKARIADGRYPSRG